MNIDKAVATLVTHFEVTAAAGKKECEAWQTLKSAVLAQRADNSAMPKLPSWKAVEKACCIPNKSNGYALEAIRETAKEVYEFISRQLSA
jgi:hypothetical protein